MRARQRTPKTLWTPEELARVHLELDKIAFDAKAKAWQGHQGGGPASFASKPLTQFDLSAILGELWGTARGAWGNLVWTIATPAMLFGFILCRKPLGFEMGAPVAALAGFTLTAFCVAALWEWLTRAELSGKTAPVRPLLEPYWRFDKQRFVLVRNLTGLVVAICVCRSLGFDVAVGLLGVSWPLSVAVFLLACFAIAYASFYGTALVANKDLDAGKELRLLWPPDAKIVLGAMIALMPAMLAVGAIGFSFAEIGGATFFNPTATLGLAGLLLALVPLSKYFSTIYKRLLPSIAL